MRKKIIAVAAALALSASAGAQDVTHDRYGRITSAGEWHFYYPNPESETFSHVWAPELGTRWIKVPDNAAEWDAMVEELSLSGGENKSAASVLKQPRALCPRPESLNGGHAEPRALCGTAVDGFFNPFEGILPAFGVSVGETTVIPDLSFFNPRGAPSPITQLPIPEGEIPQPVRPVPVETRVDVLERRLACRDACSLDMGARAIACGVLGALTSRAGAVACGAVSFYQMQRCASKC